MKTIFDLEPIEAVLNDIPVENKAELMEKIKEEIRKSNVSAAFKCAMFMVPISGNKYDDFAFSGLDIIVDFQIKRTYSTKTWKPVRDDFSVADYCVRYFHRDCIWKDYTTETFKKRITYPELICVDTNGKPC